MIRQTRRLCLLCALVVVSKLCFFSYHKEVAINDRDCLDGGCAFPILVASWTTKSTISRRPRPISVTSKLLEPKGSSLTSLYSSVTTELSVNGSASMKEEGDFMTPFGSSQSTARIHRLPFVCRVHCISDLHVDNPDNMKWLESKCRTVGNSTLPTDADESRFSWDETDLIIVAGDISHDMRKIEDSLALLKQTGAHVVFVPGNHEAWLSQAQKKVYDDEEGGGDPDRKRYSSLAKLEDIEFLCQNLGVYTTGDCLCVGEGATELINQAPSEELWILPLDSWYDGSLSFVDLRNNNDGSTSAPSPHYELVQDFRKWPWVDFWQCRWPEPIRRGNTLQLLHDRIPFGAANYFLSRNQPVIDAFHRAVQRPLNATENKRVSVLTVTHFLPNSQSLPDWKDLDSEKFDVGSWLDHGAGGTSAKFALVGGSDKIDAQIRSLSLSAEPTSATKDDFYYRIHVFGHSHRPKDFLYKGIRYVHNPLGKPREREMRMVAPEVNPKLLWEAGKDNRIGDNETIIRYWEEQAGGVESLRQRLATQKENRKLFHKKRNLRKKD